MRYTVLSWSCLLSFLCNPYIPFLIYEIFHLLVITRIVPLLCFPTHVSLQRVVYTVNGALLFLKRPWIYGHTYVILYEQVDGLETLQHKGCAYQCLYMQQIHTCVHIAIVSLLTSYVVDRVEADAKFANFKGIFSFHALLHVLNTLPVSVSERSVIVGHQGRALESS